MQIQTNGGELIAYLWNGRLSISAFQDDYPAKAVSGNCHGKTTTLKGSHPEPGGGKMSHRAVWKIIDNNNQTFEMYGTHGHGGKEMKLLEIVYTRKL